MEKMTVLAIGPEALSVLSKIADQVQARLLAAGKHPVSGKGGRSGLMPRHLLLASGAAAFAFAMPGIGWEAALPTGFGLFVASLLGAAALNQSRIDQSGEESSATPDEPRLDKDVVDCIAGLVTLHDAAGQLLSAHGADRERWGFANVRSPASYIDRIHLNGRIAFLTAIDELRQNAASATAEFLFSGLGAEPTYHPVRVRLTARTGADGSFTGFVAHLLDVEIETAFKADAEAWQREARSANDAKTRFLAAVSHELRTPLNAIIGFSDILAGEYFGKFENERQKEYVGLINQSGHHLLAVVNSMLDMSKIEAGRYELIKEHFSIGTIMRAVDEMLALEARNKGVVLTARVAKGLDEVVADRRAIQQILINLANNAIKFTPDGGVVSIDANAEGRNLVITVSDTGIGIAAEKLVHIGKPFMQVQNDYTRQYEGTGLGLALDRKSVV
jgi:cell cycle sensor histidine kinase DivJ